MKSLDSENQKIKMFFAQINGRNIDLFDGYENNQTSNPKHRD